MIKSLKVVNLNGRMTFDLSFFDDINIVTGKNGSGKTTLLKLLWYGISGNLERIIPEIRFDSFELKTDKVAVSMIVEKAKNNRRRVRLTYSVEGTEREISLPPVRAGDGEELQEANRLISRAGDSSIFFPTFRRIEGGFSISTRADEDVVRFLGPRASRYSEILIGGDRTGLQYAMHHLAERLSVGSHRFVSSISTDDLVRLLTSKYAEVSEKTNRLHMDLSRSILQQVKPSHLNGPDSGEQATALETIQRLAREITQNSETLLRPFTVLSDLIAQVFQYKGIKMADPVTLGEAREAIVSEVLSAGEKQMLSFLCYNAFAHRACIFIDEPEISLHVDWQRTLFPLLQKQSTTNQFIVATHSPFIYTKYSDKELVLTSDRGDQDADPDDDRAGDHQLSRKDESADDFGGGD